MNESDFYVTSQSQLAQIVEMIRKQKIAAFDTEFTRETTYYPILSIVQIAVKDSSGKQKTFIVDCLANLDLKPLFEVMSDRGIKKILHSSTQDLQIFHHKSQEIPRLIIDTQIMANFCGFGFNAGYSKLVEKIFARQLDKKQQRSDWQRRPLSKKQLEYAMLDVVFLEEIYEKFHDILQQKNRTNWYLEEMENFVSKILNRSEENLMKNFSFKNKNLKKISQIRNIVLCREKWAQKVDVPRQHLIRDETIETIVDNGSIGKNFCTKFTPEIADEVKKILSEDGEILEKSGRFFLSEKQKKSFDEAKKIIAKTSAQENFSEQFLLTSADLKKIIHDKKCFDEIVSGWRHQLIGDELRNLIYNS